MDTKKPKAPPSSYLIFCNYERENVKNALLEHSNGATIRITDIQKELSAKWKGLSEEERSKYDEEAQMLKMKYNEDLMEWQKLQTTDSPDTISDSLVKFPTMKIQKIMHLNKKVKKINNDAINVFQKATLLFLLELVRKTIDFKNEKNPSRYITSLDIISCIKREGIKYKFLEDCLYLLKDESSNIFFLDEEEEEEPIFYLREEDKKVYDYDIEEKKANKIKKKEPRVVKGKEKDTGGKKPVYADITSYFKKM